MVEPYWLTFSLDWVQTQPQRTHSLQEASGKLRHPCVMFVHRQYHLHGLFRWDDDGFQKQYVKDFRNVRSGTVEVFLRFKVNQFKGSLFVFQQKYVEDLLKKTWMLHCKSMASPMNNNENNTYIGQSRSADLTRYKKKNSLVGYYILLEQGQILCMLLE